MITKVLGRWLISIAIAVVAISALGLVLNQSSVQARVNAVHDWPGAFSPCDNPVSLQQCIDLVPAGDVIHILPGTYTQSVTLNKPISLIGDNQVSTTLFAEPFQRVLTHGEYSDLRPNFQRRQFARYGLPCCLWWRGVHYRYGAAGPAKSDVDRKHSVSGRRHVGL